MAPLLNPYVAGRALGQDHGFFGRDDVFEHVVSTLRSPDQNAVVLAGQRRIGKTSILLQLQRRLPSHGFVLVYFDLMDRAKKPLSRVLFEWASTIARQVGIPVPSADEFDDDGDHFQSTFLPSLYRHLSDDRRPVLLLDEFDVLDVAAEEQLPASMAARAFFPYLRQLMASEPRLGFVFVIGRKAEDLSIQVKATFKGAHLKRVSVLDESSARSLITLAQTQGSLRFSESAVARVMDWTAGHPYLTQLLCQVIWERSYRSSLPGSSTPLVDSTDVDAALAQALEQGEHVFEWIWDGLPPAERLIFAAIAEGTEERRTVRTEDVMQLLQGHGIRILTRELELAPDLLVQWEMLSRTADGYRFPVEMLRLWVFQNKPLSRAKEELDRIVPLADSLYRSADAYYRNGRLDDALEQLRKALNANPNHLKARLRIGEILQEQGKLQTAVEELEHAYRWDEDAARYPLLRALLLRGEELERAGTNATDLLTFYGRVLDLSPNEPLALERTHELNRRIGEEHEASGRLMQALRIYEQIGETERMQIVQAELHRRQVASEIDAAKSAEGQGDWQSAINYYEKLLLANPSDTWQAASQRCRTELKLAVKYTEAIGALNQGLWEQAQRALVEIVATRPDYRDSTDRLSEAVYRSRTTNGRNPGISRRWFRIQVWKASLCSCLLFMAGLLCGFLIRKRPSVPSVVGAGLSTGSQLTPGSAGTISAASSNTFPSLRSSSDSVRSIDQSVSIPRIIIEKPPAPKSPILNELNSRPTAPAPTASEPAVRQQTLEACNCNNPDSCTNKGNLLRKSNLNLALACYIKACRLKSKDGCSWTAFIYNKKQNRTLAHRYYKEACHMGDPVSCISIDVKDQ